MYYQNEKSDCARSALRNLLIYLYKNENMSNIYIDRNISNFFDMKIFLKNIGIIYEGYCIEDLNELKKENLPLIAQVKNGNYSHFVVIVKIDKYIHYIDSEHGSIKMRVKDFYQIFEKNILIKSNIGELTKIKLASLLYKKEKIGYIILFIIEFFFILSTLYLLNQKKAFPISLIFLFISMVIITIYNIYNYKIRNRLEKRILIPYLKKYPKKENFFHLTKLLDEFIKRINCLYNYGIIIIIGTLIFANNYIHISILSILSILIVAYILLNKKNIDYKNREIKIKEKEFIDKLDQSNVDTKLLFNTKKEATKSLFLNIYPLFIEFFFISMIIIFNMVKDNVTTMSNYLFYIFFTYSYTNSLYLFAKNHIDNNKVANQISLLNEPIDEFLIKKEYKH